MLKRILSFALVLLMAFSVVGCARPDDILTPGVSVVDGKDHRTVTIKNYGVTIDIPEKWYIDMEDAAVDLFCEGGNLYMAVYGFAPEEIEDDPLDVWEDQNELGLEACENVQKLSHKPSFESDDKTFETVLYSCTVEGIKQYYYYVFAQSKEDPQVFLWISFGGSPSEVRDNFDLLEDIVDSVKFS